MDNRFEEPPWMDNVLPLLEGLKIDYNASDIGPKLVDGVSECALIPRIQCFHDSQKSRSTTTNNTFNPSKLSFLSLPPELRVQIYDYLLVSRNHIRTNVCNYFVTQDESGNINNDSLRIVAFKSQGNFDPKSDIHPEILSTCRLIHLEAKDVLYKENLFKRLRSIPLAAFRLRDVNACARRAFGCVPAVRPLCLQKSNLISRISLSLDEFPLSIDDNGSPSLEQHPALEELTLEISLRELARNKPLLLQCIRAAGRRQPSLKRLMIRVDIGTEYWSWAPEKRQPLDFDRHVFEKEKAEAFIEATDIFPNQTVGWEFEAYFEDWTQYQTLVFYVGKKVAPDIICRVQGFSCRGRPSFHVERPWPLPEYDTLLPWI